MQFILVGAVYNNALTNCATRVCCACLDEIACVAVMYLTLRTVCERHGRKNPLPFPFSKRSHVGNLRQTIQGKGRSSKRKENRRLSFLFAPAAGEATLPPSADGESPAEVQRKTPRPSGANTPAAVRVPPCCSVQKNIYKKEPLHPCSSSFPCKNLIEQSRYGRFLVDTRDRLGEHRCNRQNVDLIQLLVVGQRDGIEDGQLLDRAVLNALDRRTGQYAVACTGDKPRLRRRALPERPLRVRACLRCRSGRQPECTSCPLRCR